jgi:hypothetical protein
MHRRAFSGDVPLPAIGSRDLIDPKAGTDLPQTNGAPRVVPFAVLLLLAGGYGAFPRRRAHVPFT